MPGAGRWRLRLLPARWEVPGLGRLPACLPAFPLLPGAGMADAAQLRVQEAVEGMVQDLERETIRKMQGTMFRCSAACCENSKASMQQVHQCIERCHTPLAQAQALVTQELERFQDRLSRCSMHCTDKAKDSFDSGGKEHLVKQQLETCVTKCVDDHMSLIPSMGKKMKESLAGITQ